MHRSIYLTAAVAGLALSAFLSSVQREAYAHCEVPCGIYDDHARIVLMLEDTTTIAKATDQILALDGKSDALSTNQVTRWVLNKEEHATRIQHTIAQYFLTQRVKPVEVNAPGWGEYVMRVTQHHAVMVAAMKTKQTVDPATVTTLREAIEQIAVYYPAPGQDHDHRHGG